MIGQDAQILPVAKTLKPHYTMAMNELTNKVNAVTNPQEAVQEYMGEQFIEWLMNYIPHEMQGWEILDKIRNSHARPEKLRKLVLQVYLSADAYFGGREGDPGFLRFAISNLSESDDPQAEHALEILEKRREAELIGHKVEKGLVQTVHQEQWHKLLLKLGIMEEEIKHAETKEATRNYVAELSDLYSTSEWQIAVGALASLDRSVAVEYRAIMELLKNNFQVMEKDLQVLADLTAVENRYANASHILDKIVFDQEAKDLVWDGASRELAIRQEFLNGLEKYLES